MEFIARRGRRRLGDTASGGFRSIGESVSDQESKAIGNLRKVLLRDFDVIESHMERERETTFVLRSFTVLFCFVLFRFLGLKILA